MAQEWYYFGCGRGPGHYLFREGMRSVGRTDNQDRVLSKLNRGVFDGLLAPLVHPVALYQATYNVLEGMGFAVVAWHDQSEDKRAGSNSAIFAPITSFATAYTYEQILHIGQEKFPQVFARLPQPLTRWVRGAAIERPPVGSRDVT